MIDTEKLLTSARLGAMIDALNAVARDHWRYDYNDAEQVLRSVLPGLADQIEVMALRDAHTDLAAQLAEVPHGGEHTRAWWPLLRLHTRAEELARVARP